ncbi:zinc transporter ZIP13-like [Acanthaster planci]|uniref:Zinc transporter ZIP13-like n=1 Tax=Acanthaster planci TaxID=133434 RepID=A0A8B7YY34_ACAPL|nr:zinc transporter ZIP13-like [Acanthaster planci]
MTPPTRNGLFRGRQSFFNAVLVVFLLLSPLASCDIHRAKTHTGKVSPYPTSQLRANREKSNVNGEAVVVSDDEGELFSEFKTESEAKGLEAWVCALLATVLVGMTGIFPLLLPIDIGPDVQNGEGAAKFKCLLSFAVGGLLGDVFLHLMPEAWSHIAPEDHDGQMRIGMWVLAGIFTFLVLEKIFGDGESHQHEDVDSKSKVADGACKERRAAAHTALPDAILPPSMNGRAAILPKTKKKTRKRKRTHENGRSKGGAMANGLMANGHAVSQVGRSRTAGCQAEDNREIKVKVIGYLNLLANFIDNFTHGLAVAGSFLVSNKVGLLTTAAILLHEIPHEIGDFAILLQSGFGRWQAAKAQVCTATGGLCGALLALMSESAEKAGDSAAWILPFTSGGFLNIALVTVLPDLLEESNPRESIKQVVFLLCGVAVMGAVNLIVD